MEKYHFVYIRCFLGCRSGTRTPILSSRGMCPYFRVSERHKRDISRFLFIAAGLGLEPRLPVPETEVLPLDDPAAIGTNTLKYLSYVRTNTESKLCSPLDESAIVIYYTKYPHFSIQKLCYNTNHMLQHFRPKKLTIEEIRNGCVYANKGNEDEIRICAMDEEFRQGMDAIKETGRAVTFFGSARTPISDPYYQKAKKLAERVVRETSCAVVTGGGPGIMGGANEGAYKAGGESVGFTIKLPMEQTSNPFLTHEVPFYYFFTRKVSMTFAADAFLVFPGGFGTMDEVFEVLTLVQTKKMEKVPIIFVGVDFWKPLMKFIEDSMRDKEKTISPEDMDLFTVTDDEDLIIELIKKAPTRER